MIDKFNYISTNIIEHQKQLQRKWKRQITHWLKKILLVLGFELKALCLLGRHYYLRHYASPSEIFLR
jgi:hypothetical protein